MNKLPQNFFKNNATKNISRGAWSLAVAAGLSLAAGTAFADDPTSMAPPIQTSASAGFGTGTNAAADSVFNWQEIPANQQVPLTRATFDQGGYQLYDTAGETIVVPFANQNLYVMKFATSQNGTLYFENQGGFPVLFVPKGGFVENATVAGARWYPFGENFHPEEPVFLGIAPSYPEFIDLGWYPDTYFYGGYYGHTSFLSGGIFLPTVGLFFSIGGHPYYGWHDYHNYYFSHPGFYHTGYYNRDFYHYAGSGSYHNFEAGRRFGGGGGSYVFNHGGGLDHGYAGRVGGINRGYAGRSAGGGFSSGRTFRGGLSSGNGSHNYTVNRSTTVNNFGGGQRFGGSQNGSRTFRGASNYGGGQPYSGGHSYSSGASSQGSTRSFGGGQSSGGSHSFSSGRSFGGGQGTRSVSSSQSTRSVSSGGGSRGGSSGDGGNRGGGGGRSR